MYRLEGQNHGAIVGKSLKSFVVHEFSLVLNGADFGITITHGVELGGEVFLFPLDAIQLTKLGSVCASLFQSNQVINSSTPVSEVNLEIGLSSGQYFTLLGEEPDGWYESYSITGESFEILV